MESSFDFEVLKTNGIKVNYYFICKRKLWLFDKKLGMEGTSEKVSLGKLLHEYSYPKERKRNVLIDNLISIDIVNDETVSEVKYSKKMEEANRWQLYYYLFYLEQLGIKRRGLVNYPRQMRKEEIKLTEEVKEKLVEILKDIKAILSLPQPPSVERKSYCRKCAYYYFCFVE